MRLLVKICEADDDRNVVGHTVIAENMLIDINDRKAAGYSVRP
jgi:hypothetical protein